MKLLRQDAVGPPSQSIPLAIIEPEAFSSDPDFRRGVHEYMGTSEVGTVATHSGSAHPPSHYPSLYPHAAGTSIICAIPAVKRHRECSSERVGSRGRGQPCSVLYQRGVLSPLAEALGRTACACVHIHMSRMMLMLESGKPCRFPQRRSTQTPGHHRTHCLASSSSFE